MFWVKRNKGFDPWDQSPIEFCAVKEENVRKVKMKRGTTEH